jgi:antitoxin YefM
MPRTKPPATVTLSDARATDDWTAIQETLYLLSVPGMRESVRKGMQAPVKACAKEPGW